MDNRRISEKYLDEVYDMKKHADTLGGKEYRKKSHYRKNGKKQRKEKFDEQRKNKYAERYVNDYDEN